MTAPFTHVGKQVLSLGHHYADAADDRAAAFIVTALNAHAPRHHAGGEQAEGGGLVHGERNSTISERYHGA